ncbi:MAG: hydrogenase formation protein HypD [Bacteroidota bacterium]
MKYLDEYRDGQAASRLAGQIDTCTTQPWTLMEICGGQTHTIVKYGLEELLPPSMHLIHGPGCPVCVTPIGIIDQAHRLAATKDVIFTAFGDMLRVPGSAKDLLSVKAEGGDVRVVYSPLDAIRLAEREQTRHVVFFGIGFETTAPTTALAVLEADRLNLDNFSVLCSHVLVPPAIEAILSSPSNTVQGLLAAGHVCTITGFNEYFSLADKYHIPIVVTGFEPVDILQGILMTVKQLESGRCEVQNQYSRTVQRCGNTKAIEIMQRVFEPCDRVWRGMGSIPASGLALKGEFARFDAAVRFDLPVSSGDESSPCMAGEILRGKTKPHQCASFAGDCTPEHPLGAPMVSSEGACAAYYLYKARHQDRSA